MEKKSISFEPLKKALKSLDKAILQPKNEYTRDSVIQRFEYTFELSWKTMQKILESDKPIEDNSVKGILREAGRRKLIESVENWFEFHRARNLTSHTYNDEVAIEVYEVALKFQIDCQKFVAALKAIQNLSK